FVFRAAGISFPAAFLFRKTFYRTTLSFEGGIKIVNPIYVTNNSPERVPIPFRVYWKSYYASYNATYINLKSPVQRQFNGTPPCGNISDAGVRPIVVVDQVVNIEAQIYRWGHR